MTKIGRATITHDGKRVGVRYDRGPWVPGVNPATIKIRPRGRAFPVEFRSAFAIENNSDGQSDYFEKDCIRILPGHPLYEQIAAVA